MSDSDNDSVKIKISNFDMSKIDIPNFNFLYLNKLAASLNAMTDQINHSLSRINFEGFSKALTELTKQMEETFKQAAKLKEEYREAINHGINNFDDPDRYNPEYVTLNLKTSTLAFRNGVQMYHNMKDSHFDYLVGLMEEGLGAYYLADYIKSIFIFLSCLDGILREFCIQHQSVDCNFTRSYPTHQDTFDHLMEHFKFEVFVDDDIFKERLENFFKHRHQIMHGDKYAHFDENIATISLLFLGLIFYSVKDELISE